MAARTPTEVAALRAAAEEMVRRAPGPRDYLAQRGQAVLATLAWLVGDRPTSPASDDPALQPDSSGIARERLRAIDRERAFLLQRDEANATRTGVVGQTLSWHLCRPYAEAPA